MNREYGERDRVRGFETFCAFVSTTVWWATRKAANTMFHGGRSCGSPVPRLGGRPGEQECPACSSAHYEALWVLHRRWLAAVDKGANPDPIEFARANAIHRWSDTKKKADGAEKGLIQRPARTVWESKWVRAALGAEPYHHYLTELVLRFVQSDDPVEPGQDCVIRPKADTDSGGNRTPVPDESGHAFRLIPDT